MDRLFFALGSLSAGLAVALGAFGAHALKPRLAAWFKDSEGNFLCIHEDLPSG